MTDEQKRDAELVRQILSGDERAFEVLYTLYKHRLYRYIANRIDDWQDAEELTNDTFLKAKEHLETLEEPEKVLNWMFRIASQLVAGWHRKNRKPNTARSSINIYEGEGEYEATTVVHQAAQENTTETVRWIALSEAIAQLPELERRMLQLQLERKDYREIAEICQISVGSVRNRLPRAKKKLEAWGVVWEEANAEGLDLGFSEFNKKSEK